MSTQITIPASKVMADLMAESTNASRTYRRTDGTSDFEAIVIDEQEFLALEPVMREAFDAVAQKVHAFTTRNSVNSTIIQYTFGTIPYDTQQTVSGMIESCIVDYMMADWLGAVRPEMRQRYLDRYAMQLDSLMRLLHNKPKP